MGCMSQNYRLLNISNLSVRNFRISLLIYSGSLSGPRDHRVHSVKRPADLQLYCHRRNFSGRRLSSGMVKPDVCWESQGLYGNIGSEVIISSDSHNLSGRKIRHGRYDSRESTIHTNNVFKMRHHIAVTKQKPLGIHIWALRTAGARFLLRLLYEGNVFFWNCLLVLICFSKSNKKYVSGFKFPFNTIY